MLKNIIIIGASGHGQVIADIIRKNNDNLIGFLDDNRDYKLSLGNLYLGQIKDIKKYIDTSEFVIGIGDNYIRKQISEISEVKWFAVIHPMAQIAANVKIGEGSVIMANAVINISTKIGKHCIINTGVVVEHDNQIEDYVHLSPNVTLCGVVSIGELTHMGASSTVINNIRICSHVIVGAGGVVIKDLNEKGTYVGSPTKLIRRKTDKKVFKKQNLNFN